MWEEVYEAHYSELLRYCTAACRDTQLAEDLVQEAFMKALQNTDTFEELGPSQQRAWLFRTMKNLLCDRYRRAMLELSYAQSIEPDAAVLETGFQQTENELVLQSLDPEDRMLFQLRYIEGSNAAELSQMLGIPTGTIRSRLSRCRKYLQKAMEI